MVSWYLWMNYIYCGMDNFKDVVQVIVIIFDVSIVGVEVGVVLQEVVIVFNEVKMVVKEICDGMQVVFFIVIMVIVGFNEVYLIVLWIIVIVDLFEWLKIVCDIVSQNIDGKVSIGVCGDVLFVKNVGDVIVFICYYFDFECFNVGVDCYVNVVMEVCDGFLCECNGGIGLLYKCGGIDLVDYQYWVGVDMFNVKVGFLIFINVLMVWGGVVVV